MLDAGKLRHRLTILELEAEQDSTTGEMEESWTVLDTVWGAFEPYSTKDKIAAASVNSQTMARAIIRYRDDIIPNMRISFRNKLYEIEGPALSDPDSGLEYLTLMLREIEDEQGGE